MHIYIYIIVQFWLKLEEQKSLKIFETIPIAQEYENLNCKSQRERLRVINLKYPNPYKSNNMLFLIHLCGLYICTMYFVYYFLMTRKRKLESNIYIYPRALSFLFVTDTLIYKLKLIICLHSVFS